MLRVANGLDNAGLYIASDWPEQMCQPEPELDLSYLNRNRNLKQTLTETELNW